MNTLPPLSEALGDPPVVRHATPAERALAMRTLGAARALAWGGVALVVLAGLVAAAVGVSLGEPALVGMGLLIGAASGAWVVWLTRAARSRQWQAPETARALYGAVTLSTGIGTSGAWEHDVRVGGTRVTLPSHWRSYLAAGQPATVWAIETTDVPVAVAIENGPSADADAALGADRLLSQDSRPGAYLAVAIGATAGVVAVAFGMVPTGGSYGPLAAGLGAASVPALAAVWLDVRQRGRLHGAYFDGGARYALSPAARRGYRLHRAALYGAAGAAAGGLGVAVGLSGDAPPLAFAALAAVAAMAVAPLPNDEPPADLSNPGSGDPRPAVS